MLAHWLQPEKDAPVGDRESWQLGAQVTSFFPEMAELPRGAVALLGYDAAGASAIRRQLWSLSWNFGKLPVVDLGNLRKPDPAFAAQVIRECLDGGLIVLCMGAPADLAIGQYQAYQDKIKGAHVCLVSNRLDYTARPGQQEKTLLQRILRPGQGGLFHLSLLGFQRHFADPEIVRQFREEHHFELYSLGQVKHAPEQMEPVIRDADMLGIQLSALQSAFAPAALHPDPNGLDGMEICHLARFAGISDKLSSFSIGGWNPTRDTQRQTARMAAQIIWYFLEGVAQRQGDFPVSMDGLVEYRVDHSNFSEPLIFWKSTRTERWWLQVTVGHSGAEERHRLVPCTYADYQEVCREEMPERVLQAQIRYR